MILRPHTIVILVAFLVSSGLQAEPCPGLPDITRVIRAYWNHSPVYCSLLCGMNAGEMGRRLVALLPEIFTPRNTHLLYLSVGGRPPFTDDFLPDSAILRAAVTRSHPGGTTWAYHVVLEWNGYVIDLDHPDQAPIPVRRYMARMFPSHYPHGLNLPLGVRRLPLERYLSHYPSTRPTLGTFRSFMKEVDETVPISAAGIPDPAEAALPWYRRIFNPRR